LSQNGEETARKIMRKAMEKRCSELLRKSGEPADEVFEGQK